MKRMAIVSGILVEAFSFPPSSQPPLAGQPLLLAGAGVRGLEINETFVKFTAIGLYARSDSVPFLSATWKDKSPQELNATEEFFLDFISGPFEKATQVSMILPLTGEQYSTKVAENCTAMWQSKGVLTDAETEAIEKFQEVFKEVTFSPGNSIVFTHLPNGSLAISFTSHDSMPTEPSAVINNKLLSEAILASIICKNGVSSSARLSLATRLSSFMNLGFSDVSKTTTTDITVESFTFPPTVKPPSSTDALILAGAGERSMNIEGKTIKFTAIGVYMEEKGLDWLRTQWKGKTGDELHESEEFFTGVITGPFVKFVRVTMILPLSGKQYSEKVAENCVAIWKSKGCFSEAEERAVEMFLDGFKDESFPPGSSICFTLLPRGSLCIGFAKHHVAPEEASIVIDNKLLMEAVLRSIIGRNGVSPATRRSIAQRLCNFINTD